jgi:hypothetical protein
MNNEWMYFAPYSDSVTMLCDKKDPVIQGVAKLHVNSGRKGFSTSTLLQASYTIISNVSFKGGLFIPIPPTV